jgi:hypothetical protein
MAKKIWVWVGISASFFLSTLGVMATETEDWAALTERTMLRQCQRYLEKQKNAPSVFEIYGQRDGYRLIPRVTMIVQPQFYAYVKRLRGPSFIGGKIQENKESLKIDDRTGFLLTTAMATKEVAEVFDHIKGLGRSFRGQHRTLRLTRPLSLIYAGLAVGFLGLNYPDIDRSLLMIGNLAMLSFLADLFAYWQAQSWNANLESLEDILHDVLHEDSGKNFDEIMMMLILQDDAQADIAASFLRRLGLEEMETQDFAEEDQPAKASE